MKISGDPQTSARTGAPTYSVAEEDRNVTWTLTPRDLEEMAEWDSLGPEERRARMARWLLEPTGDDLPAVFGGVRGGEKQLAPLDWYEQHALVARNSLRRYLGMGADPLPSLTAADTPAGH